MDEHNEIVTVFPAFSKTPKENIKDDYPNSQACYHI